MPSGAIFVIMFAAAWLGLALFLPNWLNRRRERKIRIIGGIASVLMFVGAGAFLATMVANATEGSFISDSFEWPVAPNHDSLQLDDGTYVVPNTAVSRVQIYDANANFLRGWNIAADGGVFDVVSFDGTTFDVFTARGNRRFSYQTDGTLLATQSTSVEERRALPRDGVKSPVSSPFWLLPLAAPSMAFSLVVPGMLMFVWTQRHRFDH